MAIMQRRHFLKTLALGLSVPALGLSGCGFRLRGVAAMPFASAHVDANAGSLLGNQLREMLRDQHKLTANAKAAQLVIHLRQEKLEKQILSTQDGKVREYRLRYQVQMDVRERDGTLNLSAIDLFAQRDFTYDDAQALAKETEEANLRRDMALDLARQAMVRIAHGRQ